MAATRTFVVEEADVEPLRKEGDTVSVRVTFDGSNGCKRLEQRVLRFAPGLCHERTLEGWQEVLYVVAGDGELEVDGNRHELAPETGVFIASGETYTVENHGPGEPLAVSVLAPVDRPEATGPREVTIRPG